VARLELNALNQWITAAALHRPEDLAAEIVARTGVTRRSARRALERLVAQKWLVRGGTERFPLHHPGTLRQVVLQYPLAGLEEDLPWQRDFAPAFALAAPVQRMVQHAFSELLNNAIDHSGGTQVTVSLRQTESQAQLLVSDDGCGLFERIAETFSIDSPALAMLELSKGKLTSRPHTHTGQGLFFTSKLADVFDLHANHVAYQHCSSGGREFGERSWRVQPRTLRHPGTSVYAAFALDTPRTLDAVRKAHSLDGQGLDFERTVVPLRLITSPLAGLESRAQARRVAAGLNAFRRVEVDFDGVPDVGHAFADELFRVLPKAAPALALVPVNMSSAVAAMVGSVRKAELLAITPLRAGPLNAALPAARS
jgi:anti-sigma regulatory factor (Ser/Thr protein kinase)